MGTIMKWFNLARIGTAIVLGGMMTAAMPGCVNPHPPDGAEAFDRPSDKPPSAQTLYAMAGVMESQGQDDRARLVYAHILHTYPEFVPAYCSMAEIQMRERHVDEAIDTLTMGLKHAPKDPTLHNNVGMCRIARKEYSTALKEFTEAAADGPANARYRANMAMAVGMLGRYDESLALYKQVMPEADAHYNLAIICEARKDVARASDEFKLAKALHEKTVQSAVGSGAKS